MPDKTQLEGAAQAVSNNINKYQQKFIADILTSKPDKMYRMDDFKTMRELLFDNVKKAVQSRFPLYNDRYTMAVQDVDYQLDKKPFDYQRQKQAVLNGKSLGRKLKGRYVLYDAATNKVVSKTPLRTLVTVPYMTDRGTFIQNGHQYAITNIMRLQPGVYTKKNTDDQISAQFNVKKGTGAGFNMRFTPSTGKFIINRGTANAPAYTVLKDLGVTDQQMQESWGKQLFQINKLYGQGQKARIAADRIYNYSNN